MTYKAYSAYRDAARRPELIPTGGGSRLLSDGQFIGVW
jgi:hypothetical protein